MTLVNKVQAKVVAARGVSGQSAQLARQSASARIGRQAAARDEQLLGAVMANQLREDARIQSLNAGIEKAYQDVRYAPEKSRKMDKPTLVDGPSALSLVAGLGQAALSGVTAGVGQQNFLDDLASRNPDSGTSTSTINYGTSIISTTTIPRIVPVLDVGDPSRSLAESQQYLVNDQNAALSQIQRDGQVAMQNTEAAVKGMQELAELSQSAAKAYGNFKNNQTKKEASRIWAEEIANAEDPKQIELAKGYQDQEKEQAKLESQVDSAVSTNLVAQKEPTATDSARAGRVRQKCWFVFYCQS